MIRRILLCLSASMLSVTASLAQTAQLSGFVSDPAGKVVNGAKVTMTDTATSQQRTTLTNSSGLYAFALLVPSRYRMVVQASGFKTETQEGIVLSVGQSTEVNMQLMLGDVAEAVNVSSEGTMLDTASASLGTTIESKSFNELPLLGRDPYSLVELSPGVVVHGNAGSGASINGGRSNTNDVLLDGSEVLNSTTNDISYTAPLEAIEQFKVQVSSYSPEYGRAGGGVLNGITRSGTNEYHGSFYEFLRNTAFNANSYTNLINGLPRAAFHRNEYGVANGGPLVLPHIYDGHDRTFYFANYEGVRQLEPQTIIDTVPTALQRQGDFSQTYSAPGQLIAIYDPQTSAPNLAKAGSYIRTPFLNNKIPVGRLDSTGLAISNYYPLPNLPGNPVTGLLNHEATGSDVDNLSRVFVRADQIVGQKQHFFARYGWQGGDEYSTIPNNDAYPQQTSTAYEPVLTSSWNALVADTIVFTPAFMADIRAGMTRNNSVSIPTSLGFNLASLGFVPGLVGAAKTSLFPIILPTDLAALGPYTTSDRISHQENRQVFGSVTWVKGRQIIKAGGQLDVFINNSAAPQSPAGDFSFSRSFTQGPDPSKATANAGYGEASLLLGLPSAGSITLDPSIATLQKYSVGFAEDTIQLTPRLTADLGVRYDYSTPWTERHNQLAYFDQNAVDPVTGRTGLLTFVNNNRRGQTIGDKYDFAPRIGVAWSATPSIVFRAGYGRFYAAGDTGGDAVPSGMGSGFETTTSLFMGQPNTNAYLPAIGAHFSNPFITGLAQPPSSLLGTSISTFFNVPFHTPRNDQWTASIQKSGNHFVAELGYTGSRGEHLWIDLPKDVPSTSVLSQGSALLNQVPNPFYGEISSGTLSAKTVTAYQLMLPYPQYTGVSQDRDPAGDSIYHALTAKLDKRFSSSYSLLASFTWSKLIDDVPERFSGRSVISDPNDLRRGRSLGDYDTPIVFTLAHIVDLPFGPARRYLTHGPASWLIGGWQLNGILSTTSGYPINIATPNEAGVSGFTSYASKLHSGRLVNKAKTVNEWFDTSAFQIPAPFTLGTGVRLEPDIRTPKYFDYDLGLDRTQPLGDHLKVQFRAEAFNITNTPWLSAPDGTVGDPNFGRILAGTNNRVMQLGIRISY
jgi:Carboxypeptidase regulatory-like domain/TonB dependent receptor/TonB-dependent Receptor Plug Domain